MATTGVPNSTGGVGGDLTRTETLLGADVTMTTAGVEYDGPEVTPASGTYNVTGFVMIKTGSASANNTTTIVGRLKYGATVVDERQETIFVGNDFGYPAVVALSARVVADGATAIKIAAVCDRNGGIMLENPFSNSSAIDRATILILEQIS